jgi:hypothetical protein
MEGLDVPALNDMPVLYRDLQWVFEAFVFLDNFRSAGFSSPNPISFSDLKFLADEYELEQPDQRQLFFQRIRSLDKTYLTYYEDKAKAKAKDD